MKPAQHERAPPTSRRRRCRSRRSGCRLDVAVSWWVTTLRA